ncbi:MAG: polysaccharide deacetylase family protein [Flavobacteriales bacterium]|nr:polysaccharide deacetylase family protein [Flavobacteriales bacterium]
MGFNSHDRVVVIHADDVGMCETTLHSFMELMEFGIVSSGSVMVPCSAFHATAEWARNNPQYDIGVHLTLTSERESYRWRPISEHKPKSGLTDEEGYFHRTCEALWKNAKSESVYQEMKEQLKKALAAGIAVSHIDSHMFSAITPAYLPSYINIGEESNITVFLERNLCTRMDSKGTNAQIITEKKAENWPIFDHVLSNSLKQSPENWLEKTKNVIDSIQPGLSYYIIHPAKGTKEMQKISPDWRSRDGDYRVFKSPELRQYIKKSRIHVISYKEINQAVKMKK